MSEYSSKFCLQVQPNASDANRMIVYFQESKLHQEKQ